MSFTKTIAISSLAVFGLSMAAEAATVSSVWTTTVDTTAIGGSASDSLSLSFEYDDASPAANPLNSSSKSYVADGGSLTIGSESVSFTNGQIGILNDFQGSQDVISVAILEDDSQLGGGDITGTIFGQTLSVLVLGISLPTSAFADPSLPPSLDGLSGSAFGGEARFITPTNTFFLPTGAVYSIAQSAVSDPAPVPLPASALLLLGGVAGLSLVKRRKHIAA